MKESNFNIGFAPLDNTYFANRKYFNKYIEYTKFGILGMYSNTMPYTLIVKDKENGILVDNSSEVKEVINWQQSRIQCYIFTLADKLYKFIYSLKARGIKQTFLILKSYCQNYKKTER